jgi:WD40 repeat protein
MEFLEYIENNYEGWEIAEDGKYLYNLGTEDQDTIVFDVKNKLIIELPSDMNSSLVFYSQKDNNDIIICASSNIINIMTISNKNNISYNLIKSIEAHDYEITCLLKTDKYLISCSNDETIKIWSLDTFELFNTFNHDDDILCVNNYNNDQSNYNYLISGDFSGVVKIWNLDTFELVNEINVNEYIVSVAICDNFIAFGSSKSKLYISEYSPLGLGNLYTFSHQQRYIYFLQFSSDNKYLYSGTRDNLIIYSTDNFKVLKKYTHTSFVSSHCLTKDNYKILYVDEKRFDYIYTPVFHDFIKELFNRPGDYYLPNELILNIIKNL